MSIESVTSKVQIQASSCQVFNDKQQLSIFQKKKKHLNVNDNNAGYMSLQWKLIDH